MEVTEVDMVAEAMGIEETILGCLMSSAAEDRTDTVLLTATGQNMAPSMRTSAVIQAALADMATSLATIEEVGVTRRMDIRNNHTKATIPADYTGFLHAALAHLKIRVHYTPEDGKAVLTRIAQMQSTSAYARKAKQTKRSYIKCSTQCKQRIDPMYSISQLIASVCICWSCL